MIQPLIREEFWIRVIGGVLLMVIGVVYYCKPPRSARSRPGRILRQFGLCFRVPPERDQPYNGTLVSSGSGHARGWKATTAVADHASGGRHILRVDDLVDHSGQCSEPSARQDYRSHHALDGPRGWDCHWRLRAIECVAQSRAQALGAVLECWTSATRCRSVGHRVQKQARFTAIRQHPASSQSRTISSTASWVKLGSASGIGPRVAL